MIDRKHYHLVGSIGKDILNNGKLPALLLIAVLASSSLVVITTYQTRRLAVEREQLLLEQNILDIEWRNLILEDNVISDQSRFEFVATEQ